MCRKVLVSRNKELTKKLNWVMNPWGRDRAGRYRGAGGRHGSHHIVRRGLILLDSAFGRRSKARHTDQRNAITYRGISLKRMLSYPVSNLVLNYEFALAGFMACVQPWFNPKLWRLMTLCDCVRLTKVDTSCVSSATDTRRSFRLTALTFWWQ